MTSPQKVDVQKQQNELTTQELEAGSWLRDEQCEDSTLGFPSLCGSVAMSESKSDGSEGVSEVDRKARSCTGSKESSSISDLFAQLKALQVNESVVNEAVRKFGGGPEGLRAVVKAIMYWMVERNRYLSQSGDFSSVAPSDDLLLMPDVVRSGLASLGGTQPAQDDHFGSFRSCDLVMPGGSSCATTSASVSGDACPILWDETFGDLSGVVLEDYDLPGDVKEDPCKLENCEKDYGTFSYDTQRSMFIEENLSFTSPGHGTRCGPVGTLWPVESMDMTPAVSAKKVIECVDSELPLQKLADPPTTTTTASTRLARRTRINCKRRGLPRAADGSMDLQEMCRLSPSASCSVEKLPRSHGLPAGLVQATSRGDRSDLHYLFEKVLRPSDVGALGRIVLPKRYAESHLPWLAAREGIQFICEDYITRETIALRYRFWPNNKSRMYVLENTGEFVRKHQLKEFDRIFIYRNSQNGRYVIRARKARDCLDGPSGNGQPKENGVQVKESYSGSPTLGAYFQN